MERGRRTKLIHGLAAAVCAVVAGCGIFGKKTQVFWLRVDSITGPDSISTSQSLTVRFWARIANDGCAKLYRVNRRRVADTLDLTFYTARVENSACTGVPVNLDHDETVTQPLTDPFRVRAMQPDGSALQKVVIVK